jgi:hypothetical protein
MAEEKDDFFVPKLGHMVEQSAFTLDLYRLVCMVLADRKVASLSTESRAFAELQGAYLRTEVVRILISCAAGLRIVFDQHPRQKSVDERTDCGKLYRDWTAKKSMVEVLTLREGCNKIIHATEFRFDEVIPDAARNPDRESVYLKPYVYLYGTQNKLNWRAKLALIDFAHWATRIFQRC